MENEIKKMMKMFVNMSLAKGFSAALTLSV